MKSARNLSNSMCHIKKLYGLCEMRSMPGRFKFPGILLSTVMPRQDLWPLVCVSGLAKYLWKNVQQTTDMSTKGWNTWNVTSRPSMHQNVSGVYSQGR